MPVCAWSAAWRRCWPHEPAGDAPVLRVVWGRGPRRQRRRHGGGGLLSAELIDDVFLAAFGNKDTALKRLRTGNNNASDLPNGVLLRNNIHLATCEKGKVGETLQALRLSPATPKAKAKFILATDGETLEAEELITGETVTSDYTDFPNHFGLFLPLAGISTIKEIKDNPIDVRATGRLNKLYVELLRENPDWAKAERRADMNHFMARLIFCFFAEDTGIFSRTSLFSQTIEQMSERDGSNTHPPACCRRNECDATGQVGTVQSRFKQW